jgi:hypothetical protein
MPMRPWTHSITLFPRSALAFGGYFSFSASDVLAGWPSGDWPLR